MTTIRECTPAVSFQVSSVRAGESVTRVQFFVVLSSTSSQAVTVRYAAAGGTATSGRDFVLQPGMLSFRPGETRKAVTLTVVNDRVVEGSETVRVALSRPGKAVLGSRAIVTFTIRDDDRARGDILARDQIFARLTS